MTDRLPTHITEDDVRLITKVATPTIVVEAYRAAAAELRGSGEYRGLYFGIDWLVKRANAIEASIHKQQPEEGK